MTLYFGLELDDLIFQEKDQTQGGIHHFGPQKLLFMLESHLGLIGHSANNEHLRIEQYRQALDWYLQQEETIFYQASFRADQLAAATALLQMRDDLLLAGWNFKAISGETPERLRVLSAVEAYFSRPSADDSDSPALPLSPGYSDRFCKVLAVLKHRSTPIQQVIINEPQNLLPTHFQKLFELLAEKGVTIQAIPSPKMDSKPTNDLGTFQRIMTGQRDFKQKPQLKGDGSLLILKAKRETDAAQYLAQFFRQNPNFRPLCLIPEKNRALDNAFIQEGLPSLGILSASLARPSLQILKLVSTFLWKPIDPYKILEFVTLSVKPLEDELGRRIAMQIAANPGLKGEGWNRMLAIYFEEMGQRAQNDKSIDIDQIRQQYNFGLNARSFLVSKIGCQQLR